MGAGAIVQSFMDDNIKTQLLDKSEFSNGNSKTHGSYL